MEFEVSKISCGHCRGAITDAIRSIDPTADVQVSIADKRVTVNGQLSAEQARSAMEAAGYDAMPVAATGAAAAAEASNCCGHCHT